MILDVFSRLMVGWAVRRDFTAASVMGALDRALANRPPPKMHHSDRGVPCACDDYIKRLEGLGVVISMSRPPHSADNAYCESFIQTL